MRLMQLFNWRLWLKFGLILTTSLLIVGQLAAQGPNLLKNGDFEDGFVLGLDVANDWDYFQTGNAAIGFHDDAWEAVVVEGDHSQMIEIVNATSSDAYAGIFQTVAVKANQTYKLSFKGLVRSDEGSIEASNYGYRMHYAIDLAGNEDWQKVESWVELPWDEQPRTAPASSTGYEIKSETVEFTATGNSVTIFFRAWKKWADHGEGNFNLDAVRLVAVDGSTPTPAPTVIITPETGTEPLPETGGEATVNTIWLTISTLFIVLLIGAAFFNQKRKIDA